MKKRAVRLVAPPHVEKVWAALAYLSNRTAWISIDSVADFLRKRQIDAHATNYADNDPSTRYALRETSVRRRGWDDMTILMALSEAVDTGLVDMQRRHDGYFFRPKSASEHDLWKVQNTETPSLPQWQAT